MSQRLKVLAGNWKMNLGPKEAIAYFDAIAKELKGKKNKTDNYTRVIFPPAYALTPEVQKAAEKAQIQIGAQNVHWEDKGAFTGELSGQVLKSIGIEWVLIAHSERRQFFGETDETAAKRFTRAASHKLNVVYCVGEHLKQRESGQTEAVLTSQMTPFLTMLRTELAKPGVGWPTNPVWCVAYEPVWAIGTGKTASNEQAQEAHAHIRKVAKKHLGEENASRLSILYGGSVTPENAEGLLTQPDVDGVLVGGASLKPDGFARILASI